MMNDYSKILVSKSQHLQMKNRHRYQDSVSQRQFSHVRISG